MKQTHVEKNIFKLIGGIFIFGLFLSVLASFSLAADASIITFPNPVDTKQERINVQIVLNKVMVPSPNLKTDGIFGRKTIQAIKNFQSSQGLVPDGRIGSLTRVALENAQKNINSTVPPPVVIVSPPVVVSPPIVSPPPSSAVALQWGAYVGDGTNDLSNFESLVGKSVNLYADFEGWSNSFPSALSTKVGAKGKTLIIFWEPSFGYDSIINGSQDTYIKQFATSAKSYSYPIILAPFDEMNLNEEAWGYGQNNNTAAKFKTAWQHIHDLFVAAKATNVKFAIAYNNVSIPDVSGNRMSDYYPGDAYVDYIGIDGFNFGNPWQTFAQIFDGAILQASAFNKPIYIISTASEAGAQKAAWITDGLGTTIKKYPNVLGWVWFNQAGSPNWIVNSDSASLAAFKAILP